MLRFLIQKRLAFAIWSLPGETKWQGIAQNDSEPEALDLSEIHLANGFVVTPFFAKDKAKLIRPDVTFDSKHFLLDDEAEPEQTNLLLTNPPVEPVVINHEEYLKMCSDLISRIKNGEAEKVILSRVKALAFDPEKVIGFYNRLLKTYPNAMVFLYSTGEEVWIGASPELFIEIKEKHFKTMALAGSKPIDDESPWGEKEKQEQAYVTHFIRKQLTGSGVLFEESDLTAVAAGPVKHLCSTFDGEIERQQISEIIKGLHPTPAVCGIPKDIAASMIGQIERHNRGDYAGYFGPVNQGDIQLFVNLRSALLSPNRMYVFTGGGITSGSDAKKEWNETGLKAQTLIDCYKNC